MKRHPDINTGYLFTDNNLFTIPEQDRQIDTIIFHHTGFADPIKAIETYKQCGVSVHYIISPEEKIYRLVEDKNIAYHAGVSSWQGREKLNAFSIGIEFLSQNPYEIGFTKKQIKQGILLVNYLICQYGISPYNVLAHFEVGYDSSTGYLNRKQDPSHLFDWKEFAKKGLVIYPPLPETTLEEEIIFKLGDQAEEINQIRQKLHSIGYKITTNKTTYDEELARAMRCFNRRYNPGLFKKDPDYPEQQESVPPLQNTAYQFYLSSKIQLEEVSRLYNIYNKQSDNNQNPDKLPTNNTDIKLSETYTKKQIY